MKNQKNKLQSPDFLKFVENKSFFSDLYNLDNKYPIARFSLESKMNLISQEEIFSNLEIVFKNKFSSETIENLFYFINKYIIYFDQSKNFEFEYELLKNYWILVNAFKIHEKNFNIYLIFINRSFYKTQQGFK